MMRKTQVEKNMMRKTTADAVIELQMQHNCPIKSMMRTNATQLSHHNHDKKKEEQLQMQHNCPIKIMMRKKR